MNTKKHYKEMEAAKAAGAVVDDAEVTRGADYPTLTAVFTSNEVANDKTKQDTTWNKIVRPGMTWSFFFLCIYIGSIVAGFTLTFFLQLFFLGMGATYFLAVTYFIGTKTKKQDSSLADDFECDDFNDDSSLQSVPGNWWHPWNDSWKHLHRSQ